MKKRKAEWYQTHKEDHRYTCAKYWASRPGERQRLNAERAARYAAKNPRFRQEYNQQYQATHAEEIKRKKREYHILNREAENARRRRNHQLAKERKLNEQARDSD